MLLVQGGPACGESVKISTWNLNWLTLRTAGDPALPDDVHPRRAEDFARLAAYAARLNADIIGFQEVDGEAAAARVFDPARYRLELAGGSAVQRVGLAVRRDIPLRRNPDLAALSEPGAGRMSLRAGLDVTLTLRRADGSPVPLRLLVVHLKSGCARGDLAQAGPPRSRHQASCATLASQIPSLAAWVAARQREAAPFLLLGDFNRSFDAPEPMAAALQAAGPLQRLTAGFANPCWGGEDFIDHLFAGGAARGWVQPGSLRVLVYDERAYRERHGLSDHCPVSVRLDPR